MFVVVITACGGNTAPAESNNAEDSHQNMNGQDKSVENQNVIELNVGNGWPSTHHLAINLWEPWKELVEEKTEGSVKVNLYHGGSLGPSSQAFEDISGGVYEVGLVVDTYYYDTGWFPWSINNLPFVPFANPELAAEVVNEFVLNYWREDELFKDVVYMGTFVTDPYAFMSSKSIKKAEDFKGLKIRIAGKGGDLLINNLGAVPVSISQEDMYEALERGTIDVGIYSPIGTVGNKYYEVAPYIIKNVPLSLTSAIPVMNRDFFESLPEDLQRLFEEELFPEAIELGVKSYSTQLDSAWEELASLVEGRGELVELPEEEVQQIQATGEDVWNQWVEDANKKGYPGDQMMNDFMDLLKEKGLESPF